MEINSMDDVNAIRRSIAAGEEVSEETLRNAIAFIRKDRTAVPTAKTVKGSSRSVAAPVIDPDTF